MAKPTIKMTLTLSLEDWDKLAKMAFRAGMTKHGLVIDLLRNAK